ncbi:uncharacterized protein LOC135694979 isoform X2 [Rhopilema esculentum]|uniref:uncharacterized protein LOC135694979 isoform X2 n=1 Tax=Rhopilema esculentum TaxID=499914 RepID=UPI0031D17033
MKPSTSGCCRVRSCRYFGKVYVDLRRHLKDQHTMTLKDHSQLKRPTAEEIVHSYKSLDYMKYRAAEKCQVESCIEKGVPIRDLTRHLRKVHSMSCGYYNSNYPKLEHEAIISPEASKAALSVFLQGEGQFLPKPDIVGQFDDLPEIPLECPTSSWSSDSRTDEQLIDEEKFWYIRQWLKEKPFSLVHNDTEYPKEVFISFETEPTKEFLGTGDTFYSDIESGFNVVTITTIQKELSSPAEEFYFFQSFKDSHINFKLFDKKVFGFICKYCNLIHTTRLLSHQLFVV